MLTRSSREAHTTQKITLALEIYGHLIYEWSAFIRTMLWTYYVIPIGRNKCLLKLNRWVMRNFRNQ